MNRPFSPVRTAAVSAALSLAWLATPVVAQAPAQAPARAAPPHKPATHNPADAPAGGYKLDPTHASVILRVLHEGTSYSTFRFNSMFGVLSWDPVNPENSRVDIHVDPASLVTPVAGFAATIAGPNYLNTAQFPEARFYTTAIHRTGPATGVITGNLVLMGQTRPITIDAQMIGVGLSRDSVQTIGFHGVTKFKRSDFGMTTLIPAVGDEVELVLDIEFNREK